MGASRPAWPLRILPVVPRELSAGGIVLRRLRGRPFVAGIRPQGRPAGHWALPKGLVGRGEDPLAAALREVREETGIEAASVARLEPIRSVYSRPGGVRVFKVVLFWQMRAVRGRIGDIPAGMEVEVAEARWLPLADAPSLFAYRGEKALLAQVRDAVGAEAAAPTS
jgi:8-oxo-(d)GTP phosphatase